VKLSCTSTTSIDSSPTKFISTKFSMWNLVNFWFPWQLLRFLRFVCIREYLLNPKKVTQGHESFSFCEQTLHNRAPVHARSECTHGTAARADFSDILTATPRLEAPYLYYLLSYRWFAAVRNNDWGNRLLQFYCVNRSILLCSREICCRSFRHHRSASFIGIIDRSLDSPGHPRRPTAVTRGPGAAASPSKCWTGRLCPYIYKYQSDSI
jgi:hypothetical protein